MPVNSLLVRWIGGWTEITDATSVAAHGRREALLGLGAAQSIDEVTRVGTAQLARYADPRVAIEADIEPIDDTDTPYLAFQVGDTVTVPGPDGAPSEERVLALTVAMDEDGHITYAPELRDVILDANVRAEQAIKKMINGTLRGDNKVATPVALIVTPPVLPAFVDDGGDG